VVAICNDDDSDEISAPIPQSSKKPIEQGTSTSQMNPPKPSTHRIMKQRWSNALFLHYEIKPEIIRKLIPAPLELDLYHGKAYIGIVAFQMDIMDPFFGKEVTSTFPEVNVRIYVKNGKHRGVYFLSLDATDALVTTLGRKAFQLPYRDSQARFKKSGRRTSVSSEVRGGKGNTSKIEVTFTQGEQITDSNELDLAKFLTDRTSYFTIGKNRKVTRGDIFHPPWPLQYAGIQQIESTLLQGHGIESIPETKSTHVLYSPGVDVEVWFPKEDTP
jgi:uncharacterized protein YqjF (DUF2071 family)